MSEEQIKFGVVKFWRKGWSFGYVTDAQQGDVLVHFSVIESEGYRKLKDGQLVMFREAQRPGGRAASWCKPLATQETP